MSNFFYSQVRKAIATIACRILAAGTSAVRLGGTSTPSQAGYRAFDRGNTSPVSHLAVAAVTSISG